MTTTLTFRIEVQLERVAGKFTSKDELAMAVAEDLEAATPGSVEGRRRWLPEEGVQAPGQLDGEPASRRLGTVLYRHLRIQQPHAPPLPERKGS